MAACTDDDGHSEAERDIVEEPARVAVRNSSLECDIDVSVTVARSSCTAAAKHSGPLVDMPSEKSGLSLDEDSLLDGDPDKDFAPGDGALIPGLSDISFSPKHAITADPLDLSFSEGDNSLGQQSPVSKPLATVPEEPELEAQLEMEHSPERNPEELSTHMEEEPAPVMLDALPIQDQELSTEAGNDLLPDSSEPNLKISEQSLVESAVLPEISVSSLKEDKATSTAEVIVIEDLPVRPRSPFQTRNRPNASAHTQPTPVLMPEKLPPPPAESRPVLPTLSQRNELGACRKVAPVSVEVQSARPVGAEVAPHLNAKGSVANQFLEKIGQLRGATVLSEGGHDTCTLTEDLMRIQGAQKQPDRYKKEEVGELFTKRPVVAGQFASKLPAQSRTKTDAESDDEDSLMDFDHLPIRSRMDIWKRREGRAIRKGLILLSPDRGDRIGDTIEQLKKNPRNKYGACEKPPSLFKRIP